MEQGRPYQAFVDSEASKYGLELMQTGNQAGPAPMESCTNVSMSIFMDVFDRTYGKSHYAVAGDGQHGLKKYYRESQAPERSAISSDDAALKLMVEDAHWVARDHSAEGSDRPDSSPSQSGASVTVGDVLRAIGMIQPSTTETLEEEDIMELEF